MLAGLDERPDDPETWLEELCSRIDAGAPLTLPLLGSPSTGNVAPPCRSKIGDEPVVVRCLHRRFLHEVVGANLANRSASTLSNACQRLEGSKLNYVVRDRLLPRIDGIILVVTGLAIFVSAFTDMRFAVLP